MEHSQVSFKSVSGVTVRTGLDAFSLRFIQLVLRVSHPVETGLYSGKDRATA
jgi:hypothetical protein